MQASLTTDSFAKHEASLEKLLRSYDRPPDTSRHLGTSCSSEGGKQCEPLDEVQPFLFSLRMQQGEACFDARVASDSSSSEAHAVQHAASSLPLEAHRSHTNESVARSALTRPSDGDSSSSPRVSDERYKALVIEIGALQRQLEFATDALAAERNQTTKLQSLVDSLRASEEQQRAQLRAEITRWQQDVHEMRQLQVREASLQDQLSTAHRERDEALQAVEAQRCCAQVLQAAMREMEHGQLEERKHVRVLHRENATVRSQLSHAEGAIAQLQQKLEKLSWKHELEIAEMRLAEKERQMQMEQRWKALDVEAQQRSIILQQKALREQFAGESGAVKARLEQQSLSQCEDASANLQGEAPLQALREWQELSLDQPRRQLAQEKKHTRFAKSTPPRRPPSQHPPGEQPPASHSPVFIRNTRNQHEEMEPNLEHFIASLTETQPDPATLALPKLPPSEATVRESVLRPFPQSRQLSLHTTTSSRARHSTSPPCRASWEATAEEEGHDHVAHPVHTRTVGHGEAPTSTTVGQPRDRPPPLLAMPERNPCKDANVAQIAQACVLSCKGKVAAGAKPPFAIDDACIMRAQESAEPLQKQLTSFSLEKRLLEDEYARMPLTAGKSSAERKRKADVEARLAEVTKAISELRKQLRVMGATA